MSVDLTEYTTEDGPRLNWRALWPHLTKTKVGKQFTAWLAEAVAKVEDFTAETQDDGTRAWVTFRAWDDVFQIRLGNPLSVSVEGKGSSGYTQGQVDAAKAERDAALLAFQAIEDAQPDEDAVTPATPRSSASVPIRFTF